MTGDTQKGRYFSKCGKEKTTQRIKVIVRFYEAWTLQLFYEQNFVYMSGMALKKVAQKMPRIVNRYVQC